MRLEKSPTVLSALLAVLLCGLLAATPADASTKKAPKTGEATVSDSDASEYDPLEPLNRGIYYFNYAVDAAVLRPVTLVYRTAVPERGRAMVSNAVANAYEPVVFFNSVLQGDAQNSFATFWRFIINSTFGLGGLFDAASSVGLQARVTDLGQTFAIYGADAGPYIVLPIIGPSNLRDAFGRLGDAFMNPVSYMDNAVFYTELGVTAVDARSRNWQVINDIYTDSIDPYSTFRSGFTQHRAESVKKAKRQRDASIKKTTADNAAK